MYKQNNSNYSRQPRPTKEKIEFDFKKDGKFNLDWLDSKAKNFATLKIGQRSNEVKYSQVRSFFDEFILFKSMPFEGDEFQDNVIPLLKLLKAKITNRQNRRVLDQFGYFKDFIINLVDFSKDKKSLNTACMIFEAVVGYFHDTK